MMPAHNCNSKASIFSDLAESMISSRDAEAALKKLIATREAASFIRLGDGEAVFLSEFIPDEDRFQQYIASHFGPDTGHRAISALSSRLRTSVSNATMIGLRDDVLTGKAAPDWFTLPEGNFLERFRNTFSLRASEKENININGAQRLALLNLVLSRQDLITEDAVLTSAWTHFDWAHSGFLIDLIMTQGRIGLISCRQELPDLMREHGIAVDYFPVPSRYSRRKDDWKPHLPDRYDELLEALEVAFAGQVFLVGAGICGKVYCDEIRRKGGIGIDIGSVCDAWLGLATRPLILRSKYESDQVPLELTLDYQIQQFVRENNPES